jgi:S-adenosylmethionine decarboxylase
MENHTLTDKQIVLETEPKLTSHHFSAILPVLDGQENCSSQDLLRLLKDSVAEAQLTGVAEVTAQFQPQGSSAVVVLEESHVAIHIWPEH